MPWSASIAAWACEPAMSCGEERLVEIDRGVDLLHDGVRAFGEPAAPHCLRHGPSRGAA